MLLLDLAHPALVESVRRIAARENSVSHCAVRDYDGVELAVTMALPPAPPTDAEVEAGAPPLDPALAAVPAVATVSVRHTAPLSELNRFGNLTAVLRSVTVGFGASGWAACATVRDKPEEGAVATVDITLGHAHSDAAIARASQLRTACLCAPLFHQFSQFCKSPAVPAIPQRISYRRGESLYVVSVKTVFLVILSVVCPDPEERLFVRNFLQSMSDVKKHEKGVAGAPGFDFTNGKAPADLPASLIAEPETDATFWCTFGLGAKHLEGSKPGPEATVLQLVNFRSYLAYHIACARSQIHSEMRGRVESALQVLNRAKTSTTGKARVQIK